METIKQLFIKYKEIIMYLIMGGGTTVVNWIAYSLMVMFCHPGELVSGMGLTGGLTTVFVIVTVTLLMSDVTSNTATAAVAIPIVISIVKGMGLNPIPYVYVASVGVNLSYMLPTSIRAIPVGYGLQPKYMLKEGWKMTVFIIVSMTIVCTLLLKFWPAFSTV